MCEIPNVNHVAAKEMAGFGWDSTGEWMGNKPILEREYKHDTMNGFDNNFQTRVFSTNIGSTIFLKRFPDSDTTLGIHRP
jgi:hypothetical protein